MSKIDLTAAELREWAGPQGDGEAGGAFDTRLALALADAMEERDRALSDRTYLASQRNWVVAERDKALTDLEAAREAIRNAPGQMDSYVEFQNWRELPAVRAAWEGKS